MEKKDAETQQSRLDAEKYTDQILAMQDWLKPQMVCEAEDFVNFLKGLYGDEWDEEEQGLREL